MGGQGDQLWRTGGKGGREFIESTREELPDTSSCSSKEKGGRGCTGSSPQGLCSSVVPARLHMPGSGVFASFVCA